MSGPDGVQERGRQLDENIRWLKGVFEGFGNLQHERTGNVSIRTAVQNAVDMIKGASAFRQMNEFDQKAITRAALEQTAKHMNIKNPSDPIEIHDMLARLQARNRVAEAIIEAHQDPNDVWKNSPRI